jgi:uncharacterized membrane protein YozB (DUF420 family)
MALSLFVSLFPRLKEEVIISFATTALVTGIALIATGFTQGQRQEIPYYQQAVMIQMAGMGFGPAALAWLKRGHEGRPDTVFFAFTILYVIVMGCYLFYVVGQEKTDGPIINCFLDQVPAFYGKHALKIINAVVLSVSIAIILVSIGLNRYINRHYYGGSHDYTHRPKLTKVVSWAMTLFVFAGTTALAVSVEKTLMEYGSFVSDASRAAAGAWQFGQIIPFMMLIQPIMETIRAFLPRIEFKRNKKTSKQETIEKGQHGQVERMDSIPEDGKVMDDVEVKTNVVETSEVTKEVV